MIGDECVIETFKHPNVKLNEYYKRCICGSVILSCSMPDHTRSKKHIKYMELKKQETPLPLPTISQEIQEILIPDVKLKPNAKIPPTVSDIALTKEQIKKEKRAEYMRNYMKTYIKNRMETDEAYREYRTKLNRETSLKAHYKYRDALKYIRDNNISIPN